MKTVRMILAIMVCASLAHASFYNQDTAKELKALPIKIETSTGIIGNPTPAQLESVGWIVKAIVPYKIPSGYQVIPNTRTIVVEGKTATEVWQIETDAQAAIRRAAEKEANIEKKLANIDVTPHELLEIIVRIKNKNTPEAYKISAQEALDIVSIVLHEE